MLNKSKVHKIVLRVCDEIYEKDMSMFDMWCLLSRELREDYENYYFGGMPNIDDFTLSVADSMQDRDFYYVIFTRQELDQNLRKKKLKKIIDDK